MTSNWKVIAVGVLEMDFLNIWGGQMDSLITGVSTLRKPITQRDGGPFYLGYPYSCSISEFYQVNLWNALLLYHTNGNNHGHKIVIGACLHKSGFIIIIFFINIAIINIAQLESGFAFLLQSFSDGYLVDSIRTVRSFETLQSLVMRCSVRRVIQKRGNKTKLPE